MCFLREPRMIGYFTAVEARLTQMRAMPAIGSGACAPMRGQVILGLRRVADVMEQSKYENRLFRGRSWGCLSCC
jgi:hypothetical protein